MHDRPCPRRERGFSIVEVIIAMVLLAVVVAGATAMFGGSTRSTSQNKVATQQTRVAEELVSLLKADTTWAVWCKTHNPDDCNVSTWMQLPDNAARYADLGRVQVSATGAPDKLFEVRARAVGVDLEADGVGAADEDGLRPDVYRLTVTVAPTADTLKRFPRLSPKTVNAEMNPSIRVQSGRLTVDACRVVNQVDERIAAGDCTGGASATSMAPPPTLVSSNPVGSCPKPTTSTGSANRDCVAFKCADPDLSALPGIAAMCSSNPGWSPPSTWTSSQKVMTKVQTAPVSGTVQLRDPVTNALVASKALTSGRAMFDGIKVGRYKVSIAGMGAATLWRSKSVPSTDLVAVEAGLNSRAVLMYRPGSGGSITIPIDTVNTTFPWAHAPIPGWARLTNSGAVVSSPATFKVCLVPVPQGRLQEEDIPCINASRSASYTEFVFPNVEPGLYAAQLTIDYTSFLSLSGSGGFLYATPSTIWTGIDPSTAPLEYSEWQCAPDIRDTIVGTTWDPVNAIAIPPVPPCASASGVAGAGGGGGGGGR